MICTGQLAVLRRHLAQSPERRSRSGLSTFSLLERKCQQVYKEYMPIRVQSKAEHYDISE
jgi:phosphodiesterase/alkaline phosphatase D-like protein